MPADQGAAKRQERLMYVGPPSVASAQAPESKQPGKGSFYHPPPSAQSSAMHGVASRQTLPDRFSVITTIAEHTIRTTTQTSSLSLQGWDGVNQRECLLRV